MVNKLLVVCHCHSCFSWSGLLMTLIDAAWPVWRLEWGKWDCVEGVAALFLIGFLSVCFGSYLEIRIDSFINPHSQCEEWACVTLDNTPVAFVLHSRTICVCVHKLWIWCVPTLPHLRYFGAFRTNKQDFYFCWLWSTSPAKCIVCGTGSQVGRENTHARFWNYAK